MGQAREFQCFFYLAQQEIGLYCLLSEDFVR